MQSLVRVLAADRKLVSLDLSLNQVWEGTEAKTTDEGRAGNLDQPAASTRDDQSPEPLPSGAASATASKEAPAEEENKKPD